MKPAFVCIKVDREERPILDGHLHERDRRHVRRGGWPMTVFLTPSKKVLRRHLFRPSFASDVPLRHAADQ